MDSPRVHWPHWPQWLHWIDQPPPALRLAASLAALLLAANLFFHGAQPYAVNAIDPPWDKLAHVALHAAFGALALATFGMRRWRLALGCCAMLAAADELFQASLPGRHADAGDFAAGLAGAMLTIGAARFALGLLSSTHEASDLPSAAPASAAIRRPEQGPR
jgi:VanZ family protein